MTVQLGDPGGNPIRVLLLVIRVLEKFGLDSLGVDSRRHVKRALRRSFRWLFRAMTPTSIRCPGV
ncbi:MAG: hypothetical protein WBE69_09755 [Candidatus Binataceae bacterium]